MAELALELWRHGYLALPRLWEGEPDDSDHLKVRLLGRPAHVVRGAEGARLFYDDTVVRRSGAVPMPLGRVLFGAGAVHGLDGARHRERKQLFLDVLTPEHVEELADDVARALTERVRAWPDRSPFVLFDELVRIYGTCVLAWSGVEVGDREAARIARRLAAIVDGFGFAPAAYVRACRARWSCNRWAAQVVREVRDGRRVAPEGSILDAVASGAGAELPAETAGVELLNVLRPTVAVAWLAVFAVAELARTPQQGAVLRGAAGRAARWHFADEVRRTAPFVPALAGRIRRGVTFQARLLEPDDLIVLDVPATNRSSWDDPDRFRPERFAERTPDAFEHVPQGGGDPAHGHRCPGEHVAMTLLDRTIEQVCALQFTVSYGSPDLTRIPTLPGHGLRVTEVVAPQAVSHGVPG
jgi:fatty-acid peroxygenase